MVNREFNLQYKVLLCDRQEICAEPSKLTYGKQN